MTDIRETFAHCHVVMYKAYDDSKHKTKRTWHLKLFRNVKEALLFYQEKIRTKNEPMLFIEPPMLGGDFTSLDFGEDEL